MPEFRRPSSQLQLGRDVRPPMGEGQPTIGTDSRLPQKLRQDAVLRKRKLKRDVM